MKNKSNQIRKFVKGTEKTLQWWFCVVALPSFTHCRRCKLKLRSPANSVLFSSFSFLSSKSWSKPWMIMGPTVCVIRFAYWCEYNICTLRHRDWQPLALCCATCVIIDCKCLCVWAPLGAKVFGNGKEKESHNGFLWKQYSTNKNHWGWVSPRPWKQNLITYANGCMHKQGELMRRSESQW